MDMHEILVKPIEEMKKISTSYVEATDIINAFSPYIVHSGLINSLTLGFQKTYSQPRKKKVPVQRTLYNKWHVLHHRNDNWQGSKTQILHCKSQNQLPYTVEGTSNGSIITKGDITFGGWKASNIYRYLGAANCLDKRTT